MIDCESFDCVNQALSRITVVVFLLGLALFVWWRRRK